MRGSQHVVKALLRRGINLLVTRPSLSTAWAHLEAKELNIPVASFTDPATAMRVADGAARHLGRPAVVVLDGPKDVQESMGPWQEIVQAHSPVLAIVVCRDEPIRDEHQVYTRNRSSLAHDFRHCLQQVQTRPGRPVLWYVHQEALQDEGSDKLANEATVPEREEGQQVEHVQLRRSAKLVDESHRVLLWVGAGALHADAGTAIANLADRIGAPVITTVHAAGLLPALHPCLVGLPPHLPLVGQLWDDADLVIAIGTSFDELETQHGALPEPKQLIMINQDPDLGTLTFQPTVLLRGDVKIVTNALCTAVTYRGGTSAVRNRNEEIKRLSRQQLESTNPAELALVNALSAAIPDRSQVVADWSLMGAWLADLHPWTLPRSLAMPVDTTQTRWAVPAWVGASVAASRAHDQLPIIGLTGEQGVIANLPVLASLSALTQTGEPIPATLIVVDDGGYGRLRARLALRGLPTFPAEPPTPHLVNVVRSLGLRADLVNELDEITAALNVHLATPDPTILIVQARPSLPSSDPDLWYRCQTG